LARNLALGHAAADVTCRAVGVQRDLWPVEHDQQVGLVGADAVTSNSAKPVTRPKTRSKR
jgi:hypothetical protein